MRVLKQDNFKVYIYTDHNPPHCHVLFSDGNSMVLSLPFLEPLYGGQLKREIKGILLENLDLLCEKWDELNSI